MIKLYKLHILIALLITAQFSLAKEEIGVASAVNKNTIDLTLEEERRLVQAGYKIIQNHTLETDSIGRAALLLVDGTSFSIGPNSSVTLDKFIYNPETAEGSLEVSSRGLLRLVGGKVTKKRPALIRTNSATVGIRGGITIVQTQGLSTSAAFVYGDELTMTPNQNSSGATSLTKNGFVVTVENPSAEVGDPEQLTETFLAELQKGLEAEEEDASSEESTEESSEEESSEEESSEESKEEESSEESKEEESTEEQSEESEEESKQETSESSEESNNEEQSEDSNNEQEQDNATQADDAAETSQDIDTTEQPDTSNSSGVNDDPQPDVNENALDSSGVSDNSSDIDPSELSTADDMADTTIDIDITSDEVDETADETEEASESSIEDTAAVSSQEAIEEAAPFDASLSSANIQINENQTDVNLATLQTNKDDDVEVIVTINGEDKDSFAFDQTTNSLIFIGNSNYEEQTSYSLSIKVIREDEEVVIPVNVAIIDVNEAPSVSTEIQDSYAEDLALGTILVGVTATDPENQSISYSITGEDSEKFDLDSEGNIILVQEFDFETKTSYTLTLTISDGSFTIDEEVLIEIGDINEAPSLSSSLASNSFAEDSSTGTIIATSSVTDPESNAISYSLSGTGSEFFSVDEDGNVLINNMLDYETYPTYEITLIASDGELTSSSLISFNVSDVDEAPSLSATLLSESFEENVAIGTVLVSVNSIDPESQTVSYSLSGDGSENFVIDNQGNITSSIAFDYETATSYTFNVIASDGTNSTTSELVISISDVNEAPSLSSTLAATSFAENTSTGTTIATSSASDPESQTITYTLSGTGSDNFSVDSSGNVTLSSALDYETTTSYTLTLTASDGTNSSSDTINVTVTDVIELSIALASSTVSIAETASSGSNITTTTTTTDGSGTVTYSLSGTGSDKFAVSSNGTITTAASLDYETTTSYSLTLTASDGTNTVTESLTINITDVTINTLSVTLANSGAALAESSSSGTTVGSSSITNPESETVSYALSGTGSSNFAVDSSGNVTTNATLDFETAKSYDLTLTATAGSTSVTDTFTVNVGNVEELNSAVLRYSADYNSASRSGFSATATRGPSGSSLAAYTLEQVGTTNNSDIHLVSDTSNNYVPVEINSGTVLNWRYYFPIATSGNGQFAFAPNSSALDGKYYSPLGTAVTTTIANADFLTAGRLEGAQYWFMTTDKSASNISYTSATTNGDALIIYWYASYDGDASPGQQWVDALSGKTIVSVRSDVVPQDLSPYSIILDLRLNTTNTSITGYETFLETSGNVLYVTYSEQCCQYLTNQARLNAILAAIGGGTATFSARDSSSDTEPIDSTYTGSGGIAEGINGYSIYCNGCGNYLNSAGNGIKLAKYFGYWGPNETDSDTNGILVAVNDINWDHSNTGVANNYAIMQWIAGLASNGTVTSSTYNLYEDQVTVAGLVYTDASFVSFTDSNKRVIAMAVIPIENFTASGTTNDYFYPNFIPTNVWSYGDVGLNYCTAAANTSAECAASYQKNYDYARIALDKDLHIHSSKMANSSYYLPEGTSLWWQVLNPSGVGTGLWAQISLKDSYDGASGSTTRDDQQSLLNVVISNVDYRKNDTTRYSAGDTGLGMDGYHYWSYQGATNADNDGLGINYGTSPIECATSNDSGCFWGDSSNQPGGTMITSSDPYKSGNMTLGVNYNSNNDTFSTGSFNVSAVVQDVQKGTVDSYYHSLSDFRSSDFYSSSATGYSGFFSGILEFDVSGTGNSQLSSIRSNSTLATFTFDTTNDDVQVVAPMTISAAPSNNYTSNWTTVDTGSMTLKFGDATNDEAKSAYISSEVFAAEIQDDGAQIDGTSGGSNNLAGVMVSYNTIDKEDTDLFHTGGNDSMPDTAYSTWGFWAMSAVDVSPNAGTQNASVHLGTWVGGEVVAQNEIPTSGSASMSGAAAVNVAYRYNQTGTNYDVHKYTTTADVAASFSWGASGYSGTLDFTNFDDKNPIIDNAGFASFSVAITGTDNTYTGSSTDSLDNSWLGGAAVAGALFGGSSPTESGGRVNVNLYKSGDTGTAGANDFYMAEGIYLICASGSC